MSDAATTLMSNALETLKAILLGKLPDEQVQALMSELTIAVGNDSVAISGSADGSIIVTGSNNIDSNNQVIRKGFGVEEIGAIVRELQSHQTLASLRAAHSELLKRHRERGNEPEVLAEIERLVLKGQATGALLDSEDDRWAAQSLLDYWSSLLQRISGL